MRLRGVDHIGIVVDDLAEASAMLEHALGLTRVRVIEREGLSAAFFDCSGTSIEVIELADAQARTLRLGDATARIEHIAFAVHDLDATIAALSELGIELTPPQPSGDRRTSWSSPTTTDGVMYQFVEIPPGADETDD